MDGDILVPFSPEAVLSGVNRQLKPEEYLWYKRRFPDEVKPEKGSRWILHFGAVDQCAVVYINGKKQGKHVGGYLPFSYDITEALKEEKNLLTVKVRDYSELAPIIWAYSFFDTFNLRAQTPEQVAANPDAYLFDVESIAGSNWKNVVARRHNLFGGLLIFLGAYILYNTFLRPLLWDLYRTYGLVWLGNIMDGIPTLVIAVLIILLGLYLVKGPSRHEDASGDDYTAFKGDGSNG